MVLQLQTHLMHALLEAPSNAHLVTQELSLQLPDLLQTLLHHW